jgi:hypothetical protein
VQAALQGAFPGCNDLSSDPSRGISSFTPHLSLGQWQDKQQLLQDMQASDWGCSCVNYCTYCCQPAAAAAKRQAMCNGGMRLCDLLSCLQQFLRPCAGQLLLQDMQATTCAVGDAGM